MSMYITSERQAIARAEADALYCRALAVGISREQYNACANLKTAREMVEAAEKNARDTAWALVEIERLGIDADPCSMDGFETFGTDPDAADRERETAHARQGY